MVDESMKGDEIEQDQVLDNTTKEKQHEKGGQGIANPGIQNNKGVVKTNGQRTQVIVHKAPILQNLALGGNSSKKGNQQPVKGNGKKGSPSSLPNG